MKVFKGELTEEQLCLYGVGLYTCHTCQSIELVFSQAVNDAVCESCGAWQKAAN